jgi:hypothetical protein
MCNDPNYCNNPGNNAYDCKAGDANCTCTYCCDTTTLTYDCSSQMTPPACPTVEICNLKFAEGSKWDIGIYSAGRATTSGEFIFTTNPDVLFPGKNRLSGFDSCKNSTSSFVGYLISSTDYESLFCVSTDTSNSISIDFLVLEIPGVQAHYERFGQTNKRQFVSQQNSNGDQMIISCPFS